MGEGFSAVDSEMRSQSSAVRCRYAELLADNREFTEEEDEYFSEQAQYAYESFRDKAALSRGMQPEHMQQHAQVPATCQPSCVLIVLTPLIKHVDGRP